MILGHEKLFMEYFLSKIFEKLCKRPNNHEVVTP